ncbi:alpha/beta fold hydrolase [Streptomyces sp. NPDC091272]|uniref:alpha/beta fold hydrolase n=1 Tax=Streptomyces sp. NPDC091272 TaxID=3365981 RepID=UPI00382BDB99
MDTPTPTPAPSAPRPADVVQHFLKAFWAGDLDAAANLVADDAVWHVDGAPGVPPTGLRRGRRQVREWMDVFPAAFEPRGGTVLTTVAQGADVIVCGRFHFLVRPTGRVLRGDYTMRFTVRDRQIARYQMFEDSLALARAFDVASDDRSGPDAHRLRVNDTVYGYDDLGDGPTVLFLHGLFGDRAMFSHQSDALRARHRCIVLDMPGHGASVAPARGWTLDSIADDLALMAEEKDWGPLTLVGHSQGGMVAMLLAARRPDLVDRVALVNTSARPEPQERLGMWQERRAVLGDGSPEQREKLMREVQESVTGTRWRTDEPEAAAAELRLMAGQDPYAMQRALDAAVLERRDMRPLLSGIQARTLVLAGADDRATPPALSDEISGLVPGSQLTVLPEVAHHATVEAPELVTRCLEQFLAEGGGE